MRSPNPKGDGQHQYPIVLLKSAQNRNHILENTPKAKVEDIKDTEKLYDVLENQTTGFYLPDTSYSSLSRVVASQKYEELLASGVSPNDIKIVRVK